MNNLTVINSQKFKNNALSLIIPVDLDDKASDYNLIAAILKRGTMKYPSTRELWTHLQEMYGAVFDVIVSKKGEKLFLNFYIQFIDNKYTLNKENLLDEAIELLKEVINNPYVNNGAFDEDYFQLEKENLKDFINSRIDNKDSYAVERAEEIATSGEPYSIYKYGSIGRLDKIRNSELYSIWMDIYNNSNRYFFACGDLTEKDFEGKLEDLLRLKVVENNKPIIGPRDKVEEVSEEMEVNQGKLTMCFRSNISIFDGDYFAYSVMNSILGGGTHSKLFNEVREKNSLAYYSYSFIEKFKGLLLIACGVDVNNFEKAKDICLEQIEAIKQGQISDKEINSAISKLISDLKTVQDTQYGIIDYICGLKSYDIHYSIEEVMNNLKLVTKARVVEAAKTLKLNAVYTLKSMN